MRRTNVVFSVFLMVVAVIHGQQQADPTFDASVARPAYTASHPKVLFDEAHFNFHTTTGRYKPFVSLITNDGYQVTANKVPFTAESLKGFDVLVIANAGAAKENAADRSKPAFTDAECDTVREWVSGGGALLLIADHAPAGGAAVILSSRFGIDMSKGFTADPLNYDLVTLNPSWIRYTRARKNLADHPITRGRDASEKVNSVLTFTGQSLKGPKEATALLLLSAGRAQAVALQFGKGRVVVTGEAAMLTAQNQNFGMNYPGTDDRQFALNIMHWLTGLLK
jgi:hypothetical protein